MFLVKLLLAAVVILVVAPRPLRVLIDSALEASIALPHRPLIIPNKYWPSIGPKLVSTLKQIPVRI